MKSTKLWVGIIVALLCVHAVSLSYIVARKLNYDQPYTLTRTEYLQLLMNDEANVVRSSSYGLLGEFEVLVLPDHNPNDIKLYILWGSSVTEGRIEITRDYLVPRLGERLLTMYAMYAWGANPKITCIQKVRQGEEFVDVDRLEMQVSTPPDVDVLPQSKAVGRKSNLRGKLPSYYRNAPTK